MRSIDRVGPLLGILGGLLWLGLPFWPPDCVPVVASSEVFCNRLWTPALGAMLIGAVVLQRRQGGQVLEALKGLRLLVIAFALMTLGNGLEYWVAFGLPHQGGIGGVVRGVLWMSVIAGWLIALIASAVAGAVAARRRHGRRWPAALLIVPLPLTVMLGAVSAGYAPLAIGALGVIIGWVGLGATPEPMAAPG
ncbi:MAG: hypothetical protein ABIV26_06630 [Candidatus Limnocylindrales bacterium]